MVTYTVTDLADVINVAPKTVRNWLALLERDKGYRPTRTLGGHYRFTTAEANEFLELAGYSTDLLRSIP